MHGVGLDVLNILLRETHASTVSLHLSPRTEGLGSIEVCVACEAAECYCLANREERPRTIKK